MAEASVISERNRRYHAANRDRLLARHETIQTFPLV